MLTTHNIPHDVTEYPGAGHSFMNDDDPADARGRIGAFFDVRLT